MKDDSVDYRDHFFHGDPNELVFASSESRKVVERVDLTRRDLTDLDFIRLSRALRECTSLVVLDLSFNNITHIGFMDLVSGLVLGQVGASLERLYVSHNHIDDHAMNSLALLVHYTTTESAGNLHLQEIDLSFNKFQLEDSHYDLIGEDGAGECREESDSVSLLRELKRYEGSLRIVRLGGNPICPDTKNKLKECTELSIYLDGEEDVAKRRIQDGGSPYVEVIRARTSHASHLIDHHADASMHDHRHDGGQDDLPSAEKQHATVSVDEEDELRKQVEKKDMKIRALESDVALWQSKYSELLERTHAQSAKLRQEEFRWKAMAKRIERARNAVSEPAVDPLSR
jgi:hypothetical protein